jgi:hypothetical protein
LGHELIHFHQIFDTMKAERQAIAQGPKVHAEFLNFFGNYLALSAKAIDPSKQIALETKKQPHGFVELVELGISQSKNWVSELFSAYHDSNLSTERWDEMVANWGGTTSFSIDPSVHIQIRALREVIPALENGKNLLFLEQLGLVIHPSIVIDPIRSVLPAANSDEVNALRSAVTAAIEAPQLSAEKAALIASYQLHGVRIPHGSLHGDSLCLEYQPQAIVPGTSYNQTQQ